MIVIVADGVARRPAGAALHKGGVMPYAEHFDECGGYYFTLDQVEDAKKCQRELQDYIDRNEEKRISKKKNSTTR